MHNALTNIAWHKFFWVSVKQFWNDFEFMSLFVTKESKFGIDTTQERIKIPSRTVRPKNMHLPLYMIFKINKYLKHPSKKKMNIILWKIFSSP